MVVLLRRGLLAALIVAPETTHQTATDRADGRTLAGIASDGADEDASHRAARRALDRTALRSLLRGRRGGHGGVGIGGVEAALLHRPDVTLRLVLLLLLGALPLSGIDELRLRHRREQQSARHDHSRKRRFQYHWLHLSPRRSSRQSVHTPKAIARRRPDLLL